MNITYKSQNLDQQIEPPLASMVRLSGILLKIAGS